MPPVARFSKEQIVDVAFAIFREEGLSQVSARSIAHRLKTSTSPIYSAFSSMEELEKAIGQRCVQLFFDYQGRTYSGQRFLDIGVGVVVFARQEPHLYVDLSRFYDRNAEQFDAQIYEQMKADPQLAIIPVECFPTILTKMRIFTFGLAALVQQGAREVGTQEEIIRYLSEVGSAVMFYEMLTEEQRAQFVQQKESLC